MHNFLKFLYSKIEKKNLMDDNTIIIYSEILNITFCIILLYFIKIHDQDNYDQMKYTVQWKQIQKAKIKNHKNSKLSSFMSFDM